MKIRLPAVSSVAPHDLDGFHKDQEKLVMERVNIIILLGCGFVPVFGLADYLLYPQYFARFFTYRLICGGMLPCPFGRQ